MADIIERNADYIRSKITEIPKTAIVLGSGLGDMGEKNRKSRVYRLQRA